MGLQAYLTLAAVVFCIGLFGVITRRNTIGILLGIDSGATYVARDTWQKHQIKLHTLKGQFPFA